MEKNLQVDTETLMQICTDTLVRNLRLWRVQKTVSRWIFISSKAYSWKQEWNIKVYNFYKFSVTVSLSYMKGFERDMIMYEKGQEAERQNTERERQRADSAEKARDEAKKERDEAENVRDSAEKAGMIAEEEKIKAQKETAEALKRVAELEKILQCKTAEVK